MSRGHPLQKYVFAALIALVASSAKAETIGKASFYGKELAGHRTASGERFSPSALTAAHRSLPFGTRLKLTNTANGRSVLVRINDRGPFVRGRTLDVSLAAAQALGFVGRGTASLRIEPAGAARSPVALTIPAPALDANAPARVSTLPEDTGTEVGDASPYVDRAVQSR
jgi:rare lipoprotein A